MGNSWKPNNGSLEWLERTFPTERAARLLFEKLIWPNGPHCPHCGSFDVWRFRNKGRKSRPGLFECSHCSGQFTVTTKTPMHATKLPLKVWLKAIYLILMSSKGVSSVILGKQLGVKQGTAWKVAHAVREMMDDRDRRNPLLGDVVEVDTAFMGGPPRKRKTKFHKYVWHPRGKGSSRPQIVVAASREGKVAAQMIPKADTATLGRFLDRFVSRDARIMSDADTAIRKAAKPFKGHASVVHGDDIFAQDDVHSNTAESVISTLKRAQIGVFHWLSREHQQRYIDEIVFRRNQRERIVKQLGRDGPESVELRYRSFTSQLKDLFARALGRQVRRSRIGGLEWPPPIAAGFRPAPAS